MIEQKKQLKDTKKAKDTRKIGQKAENLAEHFLKDKGYEILNKNYHSMFGEIDIIAKKQEYIHFIEVKYRKNLLNGYPREAVSFKKQEKIKLTALHYIEKNNLDGINFSFDVIELIKNEITFIKNAFW